MHEKSKEKQLSRKQEAALLLMLTPSSDGASLSLVEISKKLSINPATLWRWRQNENFMRRYRELRRQIVEDGITRLQSLMDKAISALEKNLDTGNRPSECRAASTIVRQSIEGVDFSDFDERISKIEKQLRTDKAA